MKISPPAAVASLLLLAGAAAVDDHGGPYALLGKGSKSAKAVAKQGDKSGKAFQYAKSSAGKGYKVTESVRSAKASSKSQASSASGDNGGGGGGDEEDAPDAEAVRALLRLYAASLAPGLQSDQGYHAAASDQVPDYNTCTIVQQCLDPDFILSLGRMAPRTRGHAYNALSRVMSAESFNMLQLQQHGNMLLGEMQDWGTACHGHCRELQDPDGLLELIVEVGMEAQSDPVPFLGYGECGNLRQAGNHTFWYCDEAPQMIHQANIDVATGKYGLGDIWNEPHVHGRNSWYDYFAAYGDLEEGGGAFGLRFSGHHLDVNYRWDGEGKLISDLPVFLGHNPLIVPAVHPPMQRGYDKRLLADHHYTPLLWTNMAGIAQFPEAVGLVLTAANRMLEIAPDALVPLDEWESVGAFGALLPTGGREVTDFPGYLDLSTAAEADFDTIWRLVDYTLKFSRGRRSTAVERAAFRADGRAIWTSQGPPQDGLPLSEDDIRSNMNFLKVFVETDTVRFFVMVNQLYCVLSEEEPTNHLHSLYMARDLMTPDHACLDAASKAEGGLCASGKVTDFVDEQKEHLISNAYKYESSMWEERRIKSDIRLDVDAFKAGVQEWSESLCGLGLTATLYDNNAEMVYQETVGTMYTPIVDGGYGLSSGHGPPQEGWTGDTVYTPYSNSKGVAAATFIASVVDTNLGYLDEPLSFTFEELSEDSLVGLITPRMILSHTSGLGTFQREDAGGDPYYVCLYDDSTTLGECLLMHVLADENYADPTQDPGSYVQYNNEAFDILAEIAVRKTGLNNFGEISEKYIAEPLGMDATTYECPVLGSTFDKPHVAWGLCSTGNDFPKFVQLLVSEGMGPDGVRVLSKYGVSQMFSHGGGSAVGSGDALFGIPDPTGPLMFTRCYPRMREYDGVPFPLPTNPYLDYGLGTMFLAGNYGEVFGHLGSTGGAWFVAPGRYAYYLAWMNSPVTNPSTGPLPYLYISDIANSLENASNFTVSSEFGEEHFEEIEVCGGMYDDLFEHLGINSIKELGSAIFPPPTCQDLEGRRMTSLSNQFSKLADFNIESAMQRYNLL